MQRRRQNRAGRMHGPTVPRRRPSSGRLRDSPARHRLAVALTQEPARHGADATDRQATAAVP